MNIPSEIKNETDATVYELLELCVQLIRWIIINQTTVIQDRKDKGRYKSRSKLTRQDVSMIFQSMQRKMNPSGDEKNMTPPRQVRRHHDTEVTDLTDIWKRSAINWDTRQGGNIKATNERESERHRQTHTQLRSHTRVKNLFSRTFRTSREYGDYGYLKIEGMANTWSAISQLQIDEIVKNPTGFDNVIHIFHVPFADRVVSSHFLRDWKLETKCCGSADSPILRVVYESCIFLLQCDFFVSPGCLVREI